MTLTLARGRHNKTEQRSRPRPPARSGGGGATGSPGGAARARGARGLSDPHLSFLGSVNMETESEQNTNSTNGNSTTTSGSNRPQISQMSLYERQAVQALQALQRQPNAAQYFHQFMLQQQLSTAQLHSLAGLQQASIAASRQASSPNSSTAQQTTTTQASINLATTSAAQLISRSQSVSTPSATTLTQSMLLGSTTSPPLNQSQAQMYLRQPQLGNILVNRNLSRSVPLTSQLILMPNGAVATVQQEVSPNQSPGVLSDADQVQNLAVRNQQTTASSTHQQSSAQKSALAGNLQSSTAQAQNISLAVSQASAAGQSLNLSQAALAAGGGSSSGASGTTVAAQGTMSGACQVKGTGVVQPLPASQAATVSQGSQTETEVKKMDPDGMQTVGMNLTRSSTPAPSQTLISSATYTQIQPHSLIQQQQQIHLQQKQVVIQQQIAIHQQQFQHRQSQLLHTATHLQLAQQHQGPAQQQPQQQAQTLVVQPMIQSQPASLQLQAASEGPTPTVKTPVPIQPKQPSKALQPPLGPKMTPQPHIPVQVVGSRQQGPGQAQALGLTQVTMGAVLAQQGGGHFASHAPSHSPLQQLPPHSSAASAGQALTMTVAPAVQEPTQAAGVNLVQMQGTISTAQVARNAAQVSAVPQTNSVNTMTNNYILPGHLTGKITSLSMKRKAESEEEEKEDRPSPPAPVQPMAKAATPAPSPRPIEEKSVHPEKPDVGQVTSQTTPVSSSTLGPTLALASRQNGDSKPPQAVVKPQILTHVIEGFVIQEGAEPFPVCGSQMVKESEKQSPEEMPSDPPEYASDVLEEDSGTTVEMQKKVNMLQCEFCGKYAPATKFRGSKRFCSMTCAKRYNVSCSYQFQLKRKKMEMQEANNACVWRQGPRRSSSEIARTKLQGKHMQAQEDSSRGSDNSSYDEAFSPASPGPASGRSERDPGTPNSAPPSSDILGVSPVFLSSDPGSWSVEEVYQFIGSLQGCQEIAEDFRSQEIDGQALLLLKEEHLMTAMNIKLGPALKICAKINVLKET
ncbi:polyhomeotic-like protein 1 isoform X1 [Pleurodeles waltl]|uniref:polyhomeotic-like protein 1 isoform X1 n=1 Tax=Pleurodeles waltl TaxID=8319 RepID=UPI0037097D09